MSNNEILLAVVSAALVLLINWRALASHRLPANRLVKMALIWIVIIIAISLAARLFLR
ncbi:MAG: hypothetical protein KGM18_11380 [Sphingomonadales bacterium]|nr:hypothetical protein [Sphingomonadales bacterium]